MSKIAVIKTGGKQYIVAPGQKIKIEKIKGNENELCEFKEVLLTSDGKETKVGAPFIEDAVVEGKILTQKKDKKVHVRKYKAKVRYKRDVGHRQEVSEVEITKI